MQQTFQIYTVVNCADTCRDADDFHYTQLGIVIGRAAAEQFMKQWVKEHFFNPTAPIITKSDGSFVAVEMRSYGRTLIAKPIGDTLSNSKDNT